jgi:hypothetical protein
MHGPDTTRPEREQEHEYNALWEVEVTAVSPRAAAEQARALQRDPRSDAVVFEVSTDGEPPVRVDLADTDDQPEQQPTTPAGSLVPSDIAPITTGAKPNDLVETPHNGFNLDRRVLAESVGAEGQEDEDCGIQRFGDTPVEQIARALLHAENSNALQTPDGVDLYALELVPAANALIIAIRERPDVSGGSLGRRKEAGLPIERQVASWTVDSGWLCDAGDRTFLGLCSTLEELCTIANGLMPALRALLDGEQMLIDRIEQPLNVLTYNLRGRLSSQRYSVQDLAEWDADTTASLWPLLIEALETGEASEEWDGDRQRAFIVEYGAERHLAQQLLDVRTALERAGSVPADALTDPAGGFKQHLS